MMSIPSFHDDFYDGNGDVVVIDDHIDMEVGVEPPAAQVVDTSIGGESLGDAQVVDSSMDGEPLVEAQVADTSMDGGFGGPFADGFGQPGQGRSWQGREALLKKGDPCARPRGHRACHGSPR